MIPIIFFAVTNSMLAKASAGPACHLIFSEREILSVNLLKGRVKDKVVKASDLDQLKDETFLVRINNLIDSSLIKCDACTTPKNSSVEATHVVDGQYRNFLG